MAFTNILVAVAFDPSSDRAVELGVSLAKELGAKLTLLHVWEIPPYAYGTRALISRESLIRPVRDAAERQLGARLADVRAEVPEARSTLRCGDVAEEILAEVAASHPDLVILGTHGRRGIERALLGSVAEETVRGSVAPVLVANEHREAHAATG